MEASKKEHIILKWFFWHFYQMPAFLISVWKNYLFFMADYFSIPLLLSTLISPWRKTNWSYPRGFKIGVYLSHFMVNIFSRIMGFFFRLMLILSGIIATILVFTAGILVILTWFLLPFIAAGFIITFFYVQF